MAGLLALVVTIHPDSVRAIEALGRALERVRAEAEEEPWDSARQSAREDLELVARSLVARERSAV